MSDTPRTDALDVIAGDTTTTDVTALARLCRELEISLAEGNKWISVEERQPQSSQRVYVWRSGEAMPKYGYGIDTYVRAPMGEGVWLHSSEPWTHWMPLPEAPK